MPEHSYIPWIAVFSPSYVVLSHSFIRWSHLSGEEGVIGRSRIAVYSVACELTWGTDVALSVSKAELEALAS